MDRSEYWAEVREIAEDALREANGSKRFAEESIWETVDSHQWIIYTAYHADVLRYASNAETGIEEGLVDANAAIQEGGLDRLNMQLAFCAMYADVMEALHKLDEDDFTEEDEDEEELDAANNHGQEE